jgi:hypothetical protein
VVEETDMTTQNTETTQSRSFTQSFDARLLSWGAIGIAALIVAAFMSLAAPRFTATTSPDVSHGPSQGPTPPRWGSGGEAACAPTRL